MPAEPEPLAIPPTQQLFSARLDPAAESKMIEVLRRNDRLTDTLPVTKLSDIAFNPEGLVQERFRFTTEALIQLCSLLARGFSLTVFSLAGMRSGPDGEPEENCDRLVAISMLNQLLAFRFPRLKGLQLVVDRGAQRVEGLAGRRYSFFSNWELYQRAQEFTQGRQARRAQFDEAVLLGRRLVLRYRSEAPLLELRAGERFFGGYQFENAEIVNCALKGGSLLLREWTNGKALPTTAQPNRIVHVSGPSFDRRLADLLGRLDYRPASTEVLARQLQALVSQGLELGQQKEQHESRLKELQMRLCRKRTLLTPGLAKRVLGRMLTFGSYRADAVTPATSPLDCYARRSAYDLFNALICQAQDEQLRDRLVSEQLAYSLLMGRFKF